jgi:hypothetical protein
MKYFLLCFVTGVSLSSISVYSQQKPVKGKQNSGQDSTAILKAQVRQLKMQVAELSNEVKKQQQVAEYAHIEAERQHLLAIETEKKAVAAAEEAKRQQQIAMNEKKEAEKQRLLARQNEEIAMATKQQAEMQRKLAQQNEAEALKQYKATAENEKKLREELELLKKEKAKQ